MNGINYQVYDISEEGMRFKNEIKSNLSYNDNVAGALIFEDGDSFLIRGNVIRLSDKEASLKLKTPLPLRKIVSEQRVMISKFPLRFVS